MACRHHGSQADELAALLLDLSLKGGEPARGSGVETLGSLAGLLQVSPKSSSLLLSVSPQRQE